MGMVRVQTEKLAVAACVRLQPQNMEDESRGTTQTCTAKSYERSLRSGRAGVVKVGKFSIQIPLPQTTGKDEPQCRGTLRNVFGVRTKAFSKSTSHFLFSLKVHVPMVVVEMHACCACDTLQNFKGMAFYLNQRLRNLSLN